MIKSMTGFGKAVAETPQKKISIEIKSLNSKQLDLNIKLPWLYKEKESEIRNLVNKWLSRGKIDVAVLIDTINDEAAPVINKAVVKEYYRQLEEIGKDLDLKINNSIIDSILRLPDAMKVEKLELSEEEWSLVRTALENSLSETDRYRIEEGRSIEEDFQESDFGYNLFTF